ncbi:MAG TPA: hypothetical protein VGG35_06215 [Streptosporangiaceae bacterium]
MAWLDDLEIAAVECADLAKIEPLGERYHACVNDLQAPRCVLLQELGYAPVIGRRNLDNPQLILGDRGTEFSRQFCPAATLRIS